MCITKYNSLNLLRHKITKVIVPRIVGEPFSRRMNLKPQDSCIIFQDQQVWSLLKGGKVVGKILK
jgi:hypothetical protein